MTTVFKDSLFDAQWLRIAGHACSGGADVGECLAVARRIRELDAESWFAAWHALAERLFDEAETSVAAGHRASALGAYLRSSNYFRASYTFLIGTPVDPRVIETARRHRGAFEGAIGLIDPPGERIAVPYGSHTLHGYFFRPSGAPKPRPCLIITTGYDGTAEESYLMSGRAAVERGYTCLVYDGPGQGKAILEDGLIFRPDWEAVVGPIVDWLQSRPDVDAKQIGLLGVSFGGYLAPRAASGEPPLAACICDPGEYSLFEEFASRVPPFVAHGLAENNRFVLKLLTFVLGRRLRQLTGGWGLRRGLWTHALATPLDYLQLTREYTLEGRVGRIGCPTLVCSAENDDIGVTADRLFERLTCPKTRMRFLDSEGAGEHCEAGAEPIQRTGAQLAGPNARPLTPRMLTCRPLTS